MAAVTSIVLADAQATPVNHTFIPLGPDKNGVWWFEDQSQSNAIGYWRTSIQLMRATAPTAGSSAKDGRVNRVKVGLHIPVMETLGTADNGITPPPRVAYVPRVVTEYILDERTTTQTRKDVRKMNASLQSDPQVVAAVEQLQGIW